MNFSTKDDAEKNAARTSKWLPMQETIYLAGPFFKKEQLSVQDKIEELCEKYERKFFSPRVHITLKPDSSFKDRKEAFDKNLKYINKCDIMLARVDDYDPGTIWECGYSYNLWRLHYKPKIVFYTVVENRKLNVMLERASIGFLKGWDKIEEFLKGKNYGHDSPDDSKRLDWSILETWDGQIF